MLGPDAALQRTLHLVAAGHADMGRREHNEDSLLLRPDFGLYLVADGAGGENAGNVASALAVTSIAHHFEQTERASARAPVFDELGLPTGARRLATAIQHANGDILEIAAGSKKHRGMGTTIVAAFFPGDGTVVHIAHVGDSRCYRLREGRLELLTQDHSLLNDVLEMKPDIEPEHAAKLPRAVITRALGMGDTVRVSVSSHAAEPGDRYLLCSDGLTDVVEDDRIADALGWDATPDEQVRTLLELSRQNDANDNVAVLVIACELAPDARWPPTEPVRVRPPRRRTQPRASAPPREEVSEPEILVYDDEDEDPVVHVVPANEASVELAITVQDVVEAPKMPRPLGPRKPPRRDATERIELIRCRECGESVDSRAKTCPHCGAAR